VVPLFEHPWNLSETEAVELQRRLSSKVIQKDLDYPIRYVAGVDAAYEEQRNQQYAAAVIMDADSGETLETATARGPVKFPYIPGLFSFRELPAIIESLKQLKLTPDLILCDGQGIAHPRRFGLASHLGVLFNVATIGCSKTRYIGTAREPGIKRGQRTPLELNDECIGCVLRTQDHIRPVYVSVGHRITLPTACDWVLRLTPRYRLPEPTRRANQMVKKGIRS
jgi:deoxyribonuclease V